MIKTFSNTLFSSLIVPHQCRQVQEKQVLQIPGWTPPLMNPAVTPEAFSWSRNGDQLVSFIRNISSLQRTAKPFMDSCGRIIFLLYFLALLFILVLSLGHDDVSARANWLFLKGRKVLKVTEIALYPRTHRSVSAGISFSRRNWHHSLHIKVFKLAVFHSHFCSRHSLILVPFPT